MKEPNLILSEILQNQVLILKCFLEFNNISNFTESKIRTRVDHTQKVIITIQDEYIERKTRP